ncbi:MAG: phosphatase PAP2 family protein [Candidatus Thermoplasmatota archaeon]|nr:phosphatase PAP2 family protein [Candidatus Thermoplasmatota archaeon]
MFVTFFTASIALIVIFIGGVNARGGFTSGRMFMEGTGRSLRDYLPLVLVLLVYENMTHLFPLVVKDLADPSLMEIDRTVFGTQPTIWMERITHPVLTDYMTFAYLLYFFLPALPALVFSISGRRGDFRDLMLAVCLSLYIAYIGYMLVPAIGPKYFMPERYSVDLQGIFLYQRVEPVWDMMRSTTRDCFTSHHTAMSLISFYYMRRLRDHSRASRWVYYAYIPLTLSLLFSTIYLRYHWVVDVAAGFAVAGISIYAANWLNRKWSSRVAPLPRNDPVFNERGTPVDMNVYRK